MAICCADVNTHNPGDSPIIGHVTRADVVDFQPKEVGGKRLCDSRVSLGRYDSSSVLPTHVIVVVVVDGGLVG